MKEFLSIVVLLWTATQSFVIEPAAFVKSGFSKPSWQPTCNRRSSNLFSTPNEGQQQRPGPRPQRPYSPRDRRDPYQRNGPGRNQRGGRGSFGAPPQTTIKLQNPLKQRRVVYKPPPPPPQVEGEEQRLENPMRLQRASGGDRPPKRSSGPQQRSSGPPRTSGPPRGGGADFSSGPMSDKGPKRQINKKKPERAGEPKKRVSLRISTNSRKSRAAEAIMSRRGTLRKRDRTKEKLERQERALERKTVSLPDRPMSVGELSEILDEKPTTLIKFLMTDLGVMASITQSLDVATCVAVTEGLGKIVGGDEEFEEDVDEEESALELGVALDDENEEEMEPRAPVVTIMGHVDHGKTSLLDTIRDTRVVSGEAGGITQHIGAYQVPFQESKITFIDTPGHAAFSDMRARGANVTDIVILVVAADDGVKEQTADSIACARQAGVPLVVAVNKCDLETADVDRVKADLAGYDVLVEDLGGDVLCSEISAKTGTGIDDLLGKVMLQAELEDLKANPDRDAQGVIIEARVEKGLGTIATTLIQKGTIKVGDAFVAGESCGKVRALIADDGKTRVDEAGPSTPISIVGFDGVPAAGDLIIVAEDEQVARELAASRQRIAREKSSSSYQSGLMDSISSIFTGAPQKERREMCVVVKADVQGSAEALSRSLSELVLENEEAIVVVKVLIAEAGDVTKSDIAVASVTPDTTVIAFNCAANMAAMDDSRILGVPIEYYNVVYDAIDSVQSRMQEVLSPTPEGEYVGSATVQEVFNIGGTGNIAGSRCTDGYIKKGSNVRVMRGDKILCESRVRTLRNFKAEVDQIESGNECGIGLMDYEDFQPGDVIESYVEK